MDGSANDCFGPKVALVTVTFKHASLHRPLVTTECEALEFARSGCYAPAWSAVHQGIAVPRNTLNLL